jgi:restriction system protein
MLLSLMGAMNWSPERDLPKEESRIISPEEFRSGRVTIAAPELVQYLADHPEALHSLTWRQFEEAVAELLKKTNEEVRLCRRGRDGGIDIIAHRAGEFGPELTLVQCKHWEDNKVGEPVVKQLYADVERRDATRGLIVTTSYFTKDALKLIEEIKYRLAGRNRDDFQEWVKRALTAG